MQTICHCGWWLHHEIKRRLLLGRKAMTNLDSVLKSRDIILLTNVCIVKASVLAWRIPGTGEPGGLPSMGSHRVGHDWSDLAEHSFSSNHVWVWELDHKEGWVLRNWCFQIMVLEKTLESPLDSKEIITGNPKRNQPYIFIRKTDAEAEALILWPSDRKSQLTEKDPELGKIQGRRRRGSTEDEMIR